MDRRRFLQNLTIALSVPALSVSGRAADAKIGPLRPDPDRILDLPDGYSYSVVSRAGERMDDDLLVPHAHDGMAAFPGENGRVILVCNHELKPAHFAHSAFAERRNTQVSALAEKLYDHGGGKTPGAGGTTTTVYNPATQTTEQQYLSLAGTELNCAGGPTPWGTWLTCEECFESPGRDLIAGRVVHRDKKHGYVFEVPADAGGLVEPIPIKAMGRFEHEAAAVHQPTGIVYMTEDRHHSLFYRYIPKVPGKLHQGGRMQALAIEERSAFMTHNWSDEPQIVPGESFQTRWVDLDDVDSNKNDLRLRGATKGAATFARGEGLCDANGDMVFTCTIGGAARLGQVFAYRPSPHEGQPQEEVVPGQLTLLAEATHESILRNADNITFAPSGDLIAAEDTSSHCGLVGIRPDGSLYQLADNSHTDSELAGVCFSPDGKILFVNIQYPGMTLAITGPFVT